MNSLRLFLSQWVTEVDEGVNDIMCTHEMSHFVVNAHQQNTEFVNPSKCSFTTEPSFVDFGIEKPFGFAFGFFAGAPIFHDVGNDLVVEACPAGGFDIKGRVSIEVAADNRNAQALDELEGST